MLAYIAIGTIIVFGLAMIVVLLKKICPRSVYNSMADLLNLPPSRQPQTLT